MSFAEKEIIATIERNIFNKMIASQRKEEIIETIERSVNQTFKSPHTQQQNTRTSQRIMTETSTHMKQTHTHHGHGDAVNSPQKHLFDNATSRHVT